MLCSKKAPAHTVYIAHDWFSEHEDELSHLSLQSPDLIKSLWFTLEKNMVVLSAAIIIN